MTKLKTVIAALLAACMTFSFAACSDRTPEEPAAQAPAAETEATTEETSEAPAAEVAEASVKPASDLNEKIKKAHELNSDTVGWLVVPNTHIDNSVLQAKDNAYYERRNEAREYDFHGVYWADYENTFGERDMLSSNTIIYGHNPKYNDEPGVKFSQLYKYLDVEFAKNNPYIYFSTMEEDMVFQVFATSYTTTGFHYIEVNDMSSLEFSNFINEAKLRSSVSFPDVDVDANDKILVLSTCGYKYGKRDDMRFIVCAKLLPEGAVLSETANAFANPNAHTPDKIGALI
ncbi:MAG: class B sortase [Oscillospiraceae bacterium]|nr:class B sortase [Oscillospiraceae bacterium]